MSNAMPGMQVRGFSLRFRNPAGQSDPALDPPAQVDSKPDDDLATQEAIARSLEEQERLVREDDNNMQRAIRASMKVRGGEVKRSLFVTHN